MCYIRLLGFPTTDTSKQRIFVKCGLDMRFIEEQN